MTPPRGSLLSMDFNSSVLDIFENRSLRAPFPEAGTRWVIYGAGNRGREIAQRLREHGHVVSRFIDRLSAPGDANGLPLVSPEDGRARCGLGEQAFIAIWRPDVDLQPIVDLLRDLGYSGVFSIYDYVERFGTELRRLFWQVQSSFYLDHRTDIENLGGLFSDEESLRCLEEVLRLRLLGDLGGLRRPQPDAHYLPVGLFELPDPFSFIDGGAYDGDTLQRMVDRGLHIDRYVGFEPDPGNFSRLRTRINGFDAGLNAVILPSALWSSVTTLRFSAEDSEESRVTGDGATQLQGLPIDAILPGFRADLIKYDVEGAELEALTGAVETIAASRPVLAVSAYHRPEHLWEVPSLIARWGLGYRFFLRYHSFGGMDIVVYAVPPNRLAKTAGAR